MEFTDVTVRTTPAVGSVDAEFTDCAESPVQPATMRGAADTATKIRDLDHLAAKESCLFLQYQPVR